MHVRRPGPHLKPRNILIKTTERRHDVSRKTSRGEKQSLGPLVGLDVSLRPTAGETTQEQRTANRLHPPGPTCVVCCTPDAPVQPPHRPDLTPTSSRTWREQAATHFPILSPPVSGRGPLCPCCTSCLSWLPSDQHIAFFFSPSSQSDPRVSLSHPPTSFRFPFRSSFRACLSCTIYPSSCTIHRPVLSIVGLAIATYTMEMSSL